MASQFQVFLDGADYLPLAIRVWGRNRFDSLGWWPSEVDHGILLVACLSWGWAEQFFAGSTLSPWKGSRRWYWEIALEYGVPGGQYYLTHYLRSTWRLLGAIIIRDGVRCHPHTNHTQLYLTLPLVPKNAVRSLNWGLEAVIRWVRANKRKCNSNKAEVLVVGWNSNLDSAL